MPTALTPLPRLYLVLAVLVLGLGADLVVIRLRRPPAAAESCVDAELPAPDSLLVRPHMYFGLRACPHFDETTLELALYDDGDAWPPGRHDYAFVGTGPAGAHRWPQFLRVRWLSADSVEIAHSSEVTFLYQHARVGPLQLVYALLDSPSP
jgi:hypothetical protein